MSVVKECKYSSLLVKSLQKYNQKKVLRIVDMPEKFLNNLRIAYQNPGLPGHLHNFIHGGKSTHKNHILLPVKNQKDEEQEKGLLYELWNFTEQSFLNHNEKLTVIVYPNKAYCPIQDFVHKDRKYLVNDEGYVLDPNGGLMKDRDGGVSLVSWFVNSSQFIEGNEYAKKAKMGDKKRFHKQSKLYNRKI